MHGERPFRAGDIAMVFDEQVHVGWWPLGFVGLVIVSSYELVRNVNGRLRRES